MDPSTDAGTLPRLQGRALVVARIVWLLTAALIAGLCLAGMALTYSLFQTPCVDSQCVHQSARLTQQDFALLQSRGIPASFYAAWHVGLDAVFISLSFAIATLIFWRKSNDRMALFVSFTLLLIGGVSFTNSAEVLAGLWPAWRVPVTVLSMIGMICFSVFLCLFPNGRFVPPWMRWVALVFAIVNAVSLNSFSMLLPDTPNLFFLVVGLFTAVIAAQVYRYRHVSTATERQQTKWVVFGFILSATGYFGMALIGRAFQLPSADPLVKMISNTVVYCFLLLVPLTIGGAILRSRLYDIDVIIRRTLLYGALTAILALMYLLCLFGLQYLVVRLTGQRGEGIIITSSLSALAIAALSRPLRRRIQDFIDRRFDRGKYDALKVIAAFGARARDEVDADQLRSQLLEVAQETMQPEFVSLGLTSPASLASREAEAASIIAPNDALVAFFQTRPAAVEMTELQTQVDSPTVQAMQTAGVKITAPIVSQDELIGVLSLGPRRSEQDYSTTDHELLNALTAQAAPALRVAQFVREKQAEDEQRARIDQELRLAQQIQQSLLPRQSLAIPGWKLDTYYQPARQVGGDFYDLIPLAEGRIGIVIGDVTNKGMPAALLMATTRTTIRAAVRALSAPGDVLAHVNALVCEDIPPQMFVTCFYAVLDPLSGRLRFANAGHDLPYRWRAGVACELRARGMPLGLLPESVYEEDEVVLEPGEGVLFYTDGIVEAHNANREMFGFPRLQTLLVNTRSDGDVNQMVRNQLAAFTGADWEQEDDITLVSIQRG